MASHDFGRRWRDGGLVDGPCVYCGVSPETVVAACDKHPLLAHPIPARPQAHPSQDYAALGAELERRMAVRSD